METYYIYKICCKNVDVTGCYVGSSKDIKVRTRNHKTDCHNEHGKSYNLKIYQTIREFGGWANWLLVILEELPKSTKSQATIREEQIRVDLNASLNMIRASTGFGYIGLTRKESHRELVKIHYKQNKEDINERHKKYNILNKETIREYQRLYREKMKAKRLIENTNDKIV